MLFVDDREQRPGQSSNRDIVEQIRLHRDVEYCVTRMESADCRFMGNGPMDEDHPDGECFIGCERKRLSDLIQSMKSRRLSGHQLPEMLKDHDFVFIFVEGMWRPGKHGEIEEYQKRGKESGWWPLYGRGEKFAVNYRQVISYLTTLELKARTLGGERIVVRRTASAWETAAQYIALYRWFNDKNWDQHKSHDQIYTNRVEVNGRRARLRGIGRQEKPSELWKMAAQLNGIDEKARRVEQYFGSIRAMVNGTVRDWMQVEGIGKKTAEYCVEAMRKDVRK